MACKLMGEWERGRLSHWKDHRRFEGRKGVMRLAKQSALLTGDLDCS